MFTIIFCQERSVAFAVGTAPIFHLEFSVFNPRIDEGYYRHPTQPPAMAPFTCPPPGCYPPVTNTWELTNQWTGRSTLVYSSRLQPPQWSQEVWGNAMLHTGVPAYALDEFRRLSRPEHRTICGRDKSRSRSRGRDRDRNPTREKSRSRSKGRNVERAHGGEYKGHIPSKHDFTVRHVKKKPSEKELKSILKNKDSRIFFDQVKGPYYGFNTFSEHPVVYDGFKFPTAEHLLLYFKVRLPSGPRIMTQVSSRAAFSSQNGRGSATIFVINRPLPNSWRQQRGSLTRSRFTGNKRSSSTSASCHFFSLRLWANSSATDGSGALAQVYPTQEPQEDDARHRRSPHHVCEFAV